MAASSEIEKLERRYAENPDGRYFAPLSDAYRKAGEVDRALELVRAGIAKHPDYLSAHIVLGRCLLDKQDDSNAAQAFQSVLGLDPENIIALKSLAEIAERKGELLQATEWLQQLLKIDPMNTDAEADLKRLGGAIGEMSTAQIPARKAEPEAAAPGVSFADVLALDAGVPAVVAESAVAEAPFPELTAPEPQMLPPHPPEAPPTAPEGPSVVRPSAGIVFSQFVPPTEPVPAQAIDLKPFDDALAWGTGERSSRAISQKDLDAALHEHEASLAGPSAELSVPDQTPHVPAEPVSTEEAWTGGPADDAWEGRASLKMKRVDADSITVEPGSDEQFDIAEETPAEAAPGTPAAAEPEAATAEETARSSLANLPIIMPEDVTPSEEMARPSGRHALLAEPEPAAVPAGVATEPERTPFLTETMGDLYLRQGFRAEAADVFRRLLEQRPGDAGLAAKLEAIVGPPPALGAAALGTESTRTWLRRIAQSRLGGPPPSAEAPPEGPTPLEQAFAQPESAPQPAGEPARQAPEAFTLDAIFGASGATPAAPPTPPPPPTGTSFDEFFGAPPEQGTVRPDAGVSPETPPPDDDVGTFNSWLRGLKR